MPTCAFCPRQAKLSGEHIWSEWMKALIPGKTFHFRQLDAHGNVVNKWKQDTIDFRAKVVCEPCNNTWMSDLEARYAKPALQDLITGEKRLTISQSRAHAIALFAFKTAVVVDHMSRDLAPFFRRSIRYRFASSLEIPSNVQMWFAGFLPWASGRVSSLHPAGELGKDGRLRVYVCNYIIGHFAFQVVAARYIRIPSFSPEDSFEHLAVPFWPTIPDGMMWPPRNFLRSDSEFNKFSRRWGALNLHWA